MTVHVMGGSMGGRRVTVSNGTLHNGRGLRSGSRNTRVIGVFTAGLKLILYRGAIPGGKGRLTTVGRVLRRTGLRSAAVDVSTVTYRGRIAGLVTDGGNRCFLTLGGGRVGLCGSMRSLFGRGNGGLSFRRAGGGNRKEVRAEDYLDADSVRRVGAGRPR